MKKRATSKRRPIDNAARASYDWSEKNVVGVSKMKMKAWKAYLFIAFFGGSLTALIMAVNSNIETQSLAGMSPDLKLASEKAVLVAPTLFTDSDEDVPDKIIKAPKVKKDKLRTVEIDTNLLKGGALTLNLFDGVVVVAKRDREERQTKDGIVWVGHIIGDPKSFVSLASSGSTVSGTIISDAHMYEIAPSKGKLSVLGELDPEKMEPKNATTDAATPKDASLTTDLGTSATSPVAAGATAGNVIDLMVVYTSQARTNSGGISGIESKILNAVASANQAYVNSQVDMQLNLVHMEEVNYTETGDMTVALDRLSNTSDGYMDNVAALRNQYSADQVALVDADYNYCGYGWIMTSLNTSFSPYAYSVVHDDSRYSCLGNQTLTHELGHNQGSVHDISNASSPGIYPYSYGYRVCGSFRTIMSYSCTAETRIPYFSNPNLSYNGQAIGIANQADVSQSLRNAAPVVATFMSPVSATVPAAPSNLNVQADSPSQITVKWSDNSSNESGFTLQRSLNGSTWSTIATLGGNATSYIDSSLSAATTYYYQVSAYNSVGTSAFSNIASTMTQALVADTLAPIVAISQPSDAAVVSGVKVNIAGTATDNIGVTSLSCFIDNKLVKTVVGATSINYAWNIKKVAKGLHTIRLDARDAQGNLGTKSITVTLK